MRGRARLLNLVWPMTTALLCLGLVALLAGELLSLDFLLARQVASRQAQLAASRQRVVVDNAGFLDVRARWFGTPALFQPAPISNTAIVFFDVSGASQAQVMDSFDRADICTRYGPCAKDPANPGGTALGLEWFKFAGSGYYCYSPRTTTLSFKEYILLPRWSPPADGSVTIDLVVKWNALAQVIYVHEAGHVAIDKQDLAALNEQAHRLSTCQAVVAFWNGPHLYDKDEADQAAYHARLKADCRPEVGCLPYGWMGW
ncbi:MAG: hypothetical protein E6I72_07670 [Chloroflexi bacterium]|nr:MAG: hypothetical protein E6I72_07670 [Chloroflexota bacterium]